MKLTLHGDTPSKKNSRIIISRGGRPFSIPNNHYQKWHKEQEKKLWGMCSIQGRVSVCITIYSGTARKADLTNKAESIMDLLVDCSIIEDDNWVLVPDISLQFGGVDRENPRAEILITKL